jgi:hypothetical protein
MDAVVRDRAAQAQSDPKEGPYRLAGHRQRFAIDSPIVCVGNDDYHAAKPQVI